MRNDTARWDAPPSPDTSIVVPGLRIYRDSPSRLTLISGVRVRLDSDLPLVGWPDEAPDAAHALVLRRDRILEVDGPARCDSWDEEKSVARSDMTDGYGRVILEGPAAMNLLRQGAEISLDIPSPAVTRLVFGLPAMLHRMSSDRFALFFTRAQLAAGWTALQSHTS
ncbi:MAG: hypothetical protein ACK5IB_01235 [Qingshengfaniella sp.]